MYPHRTSALRYQERTFTLVLEALLVMVNGKGSGKRCSGPFFPTVAVETCFQSGLWETRCRFSGVVCGWLLGAAMERVGDGEGDRVVSS